MSSKKYAVFIETSEEKRDMWYYFIKYDGNEANLNHLYKQLESIHWTLLPGLCSFQLHLDHLVSEETAFQMCQVKNQFLSHKKLDGKLKKIYFDFDEHDGNVTKMGKVYDVLKFGRISDYCVKYSLSDLNLCLSSSSSGEGDGEEDDDEEEREEDTETDSISNSESEEEMEEISPELLQDLKKQLIF